MLTLYIHVADVAGMDISTCGVIAAGTGARRMHPSVSFVHLSFSSSGWTSVSSYSPLRVSVTVQDCGVRMPRPFVEKSVQSGG